MRFSNILILLISWVKAGHFGQLFIYSVLFLQACGIDTPKAGKQVFVNENYSHKIVDGYWLYLPNNFDKSREWPIILFLQGGHGVSPNPKAAKNDGPVKFVFEKNVSEELYQFVADSFIIINPHMQTGPKEKRQWHQYSKTLIAMVDEVKAEFNGDNERIYLTGLSRGGGGSWELAKLYPEKFAAVVPIAGIVTCKKGCDSISYLPTWIIHNRGDDVINVKYPWSTVSFF